MVWAGFLGSGGFSPLGLPALGLWLDSELGITLNGATVSAWADQSGNGFNGTQGVAVDQPTYQAAGINGLPSLAMTASTSALNFVHGNTIVSGTAAERYLVFQGNADGGTSAIYVDNGNWGASGNVTNIPFSDGNIYDNFARTTRPSFARGGNYALPHIYSSESSGTGGTGLWQARLDGAIIAASVSNTNTFGVNAANASIQASSTGYLLSSVIIVNTTLTTPQRNSLLSYLGARYAIPVTLS